MVKQHVESRPSLRRQIAIASARSVRHARARPRKPRCSEHHSAKSAVRFATDKNKREVASLRESAVRFATDKNKTRRKPPNRAIAGEWVPPVRGTIFSIRAKIG